MRWSLLPALACGALSATALLAPMPAAAEPTAFVVAMKGTVHVTPVQGKSAQRAALGRPLEAGDRIQVGDGSSASLFFSDGNVIELGERSTITIGGKLVAKGKPRVGPGSQVSAEVFQKMSKFITSESGQAGMVALAPMRSGASEHAAFALSPRRSAILSPRPAFRWRAIEGANRYRVTLTFDQGAVWNREVEATSLDYPADIPPLAEGEYLWEIQAFSDRGPIQKEESSFVVLGKAEMVQVSEHLDGIFHATGEARDAGHYVAGSYLVGRGLFDDATTHFEALIRLEPNAPGPHEALGNVYRAVGLTDLAAAEFQKALELTRTTDLR